MRVRTHSECKHIRLLVLLDAGAALVLLFLREQRLRLQHRNRVLRFRVVETGHLIGVRTGMTAGARGARGCWGCTTQRLSTKWNRAAGHTGHTGLK